MVLKLDLIFSPKKVLGQDKHLGPEKIFYQKKIGQKKFYSKNSLDG